MSGRPERVKDPGLGSVADNDGDSPALLETTATVGAFLAGPRLRWQPGEMLS